MALSILALVCVAYVGYETLRIHHLIRVSGKLVEDAEAYSRSSGTRSMLVIGDSTAVGVGAKPEETVAGRLASVMDASVESHAQSGTRTADMEGQLAARQKERYDIVLIQIGANDVIRFTNLERLRDDIALTLKSAKKASDRVVLLTAGKVGEAPFFPKPLSGAWTRRASLVREHFMAAAEKYDAAYVDLFAAEDPFASDPDRYYAKDGLHLTGDGYGFWYEETIKTIDKKWRTR